MFLSHLLSQVKLTIFKNGKKNKSNKAPGGVDVKTHSAIVSKIADMGDTKGHIILQIEGP